MARELGAFIKSNMCYFISNIVMLQNMIFRETLVIDGFLFQLYQILLRHNKSDLRDVLNAYLSTINRL